MRKKEMEQFADATIENDGRLGTHTLRKTWARKVYKNSGNDIMILKAALNHSDVSVTQKYLEADEDEVMAAISKCDFTRKPKAGLGVRQPCKIGAVAAA